MYGHAVRGMVRQCQAANIQGNRLGVVGKHVTRQATRRLRSSMLSARTATTTAAQGKNVRQTARTAIGVHALLQASVSTASAEPGLPRGWDLGEEDDGG